jgi:hypothetical protein
MYSISASGSRKSDNNNETITTNKYLSYVKQVIKSYFGHDHSGKFDHIKQIITFTVITLSGTHWTVYTKLNSAFFCIFL